MRLLAMFFALCVIVLSAAAQDVISPQKRMETVDLARTLLTSQPVVVDAAMVADKNPFNPQVATPVVAPAAVAAPAVAVVADRELLMTLAASLTPTGSMRFGDSPMLLFGQKRFKVGDALPIVFQGVTHQVVISGIESTSFTLRLNNEEITRPIKPSSK